MLTVRAVIPSREEVEQKLDLNYDFFVDHDEDAKTWKICSMV